MELAWSPVVAVEAVIVVVLRLNGIEISDEVFLSGTTPYSRDEVETWKQRSKLSESFRL